MDLDRQATLRSEAHAAPRHADPGGPEAAAAAPPLLFGEGGRVAVSIMLLVLAAGGALMLAIGLTGGLDRPATKPDPPGGAAAFHPAAPAPYRVPAGAVSVSSASELTKALAGRSRRAIVLSPGTYGSERPFTNPNGHELYAARLGTAILTAGLSLGGHHGPGGGLVRGLVIDVRDARRTVDGAGIAVWGTGRGSRILDTTLRGHGELRAGIAARRPEGLVIRRAVVRRFRDYGVLVDADEPDRAGQGQQPFQLSDVDVAGITRPAPGSSQGRAEACVWIGDVGSVQRVRARSCAAAGLWTGSATRHASFEAIDVDGATTGVYLEHFTSDSTFRRLRIGPRVRVGLNAEWADPAWGGRPASVGNVIEDSRFESRLVGVYLDEGTTRTTVRRSSFVNQTWAAIGDYRGNQNAVYGNHYDLAGKDAKPVRRDHLRSSIP